MEPQPTSRKLLHQVRRALHLKHHSYRTEQAYVGWITRYIHDLMVELGNRDRRPAVDQVAMENC